MEDINLYLITQKQSIELEYYKVKSDNDNYSRLEIANIITYYENIQKEISTYNDDNLFLSISDINKLLLEYSDGTYGILNYFTSKPTLMIDYIKDNNYTFHNKQSIVDKLIKEPTTGFLFMYEKKNKQITSLNRIYLLKESDVKYLNELNKNESNDNSNDSSTEYEQIISKIYEFIGSKIIFKNEINEYNPVGCIELESKKKQIENLYKLVRKYNRYIEENIKQNEIKQLFYNFSFINSLTKKNSEITNKQLNIQDLLKFDFELILDQIKFANRLEQNDYDTLIERYYGETLVHIIDTTIEQYNLNKNFRPYMDILYEILIRLYIDNYLGYKSYCLSKTLLTYLKFSNLLSDPETNTVTLKKRHWVQLLDTKDSLKIISSILYLIKTRTHTIDATFKYFEKIFGEVKIRY